MINPMGILTLITLHNREEVFKFFAELYEEGNLPPQEIIEWVQYLVDTEQEPWYTEYKQLIDYYVTEGLCYSVNVGDDC